MYELYQHLDLDLDLFPAAILCHCPNIRRLERLTIGNRGRRGSPDPEPDNQFLFWKDFVHESVRFPSLESAHLVASYTKALHVEENDNLEEMARAFEFDLTPIAEAVHFVNRAPSLRHLSLTGFATADWAGRIVRAPLQPHHNLSSLELHYCAWLSEAHLGNIIEGCPNLATFKFTSEASPTTGQPLPSASGFEFLGPALVLKALRPRAETLTAISMRYMPILDLLFRTRGSVDSDQHLIQTLGEFPNLRVLEISHGALGWSHFDGAGEQQLVRLIKDCPRLESLNITQIDIRKSRIRPQLEGLVTAVARMDCAPLLKGIRVSIERNNWYRPWTKESLGANFSEIFEKDHLDCYQGKGGIKLLIDYEDAYGNHGGAFPAAVHDGLRLRHAVTLHPGICELSGLYYERDDGIGWNRFCGHHEIPEREPFDETNPYGDRKTLKSCHWPRATRVLYGVLPDGKSTEHVVNERRKLEVMHRDYGPWEFGLQTQGREYDGLTWVI